jgi:hypothetical protein
MLLVPSTVCDIFLMVLGVTSRSLYILLFILRSDKRVVNLNLMVNNSMTHGVL